MKLQFVFAYLELLKSSFREQGTPVCFSVVYTSGGIQEKIKIPWQLLIHSYFGGPEVNIIISSRLLIGVDETDLNREMDKFEELLKEDLKRLTDAL